MKSLIKVCKYYHELLNRSIVLFNLQSCSKVYCYFGLHARDANNILRSQGVKMKV